MCFEPRPQYDNMGNMKEVKKGFTPHSLQEMRQAELGHLQYVRTKRGEPFPWGACCSLRQSLLQDQADFQLTLELRMTLNFLASSLHFSSAGTTGVPP